MTRTRQEQLQRYREKRRKRVLRNHKPYKHYQRRRVKATMQARRANGQFTRSVHPWNAGEIFWET